MDLDNGLTEICMPTCLSTSSQVKFWQRHLLASFLTFFRLQIFVWLHKASPKTFFQFIKYVFRARLRFFLRFSSAKFTFEK